MPVVRLDVAYDGSGYHGFARQPGMRTVQGELEGALEKMLGVAPETTCAGRTDAGVHARHQVVSFQMESVTDMARLRRGLDGLLGDEVSVISAMEVVDGFNARFAPAWRSYRYFVDPRPAGDPLARGWVWHLGRPLDLAGMDRAAACFVGPHDFASFCRRRPGATTLREVLESRWWEEDGRMVFGVRAKAFCHQMVRSMTGHCVDVGLGRVDAASTPDVISARHRQAVGTVAPPHGLTLWEVGFGRAGTGDAELAVRSEFP